MKKGLFITAVLLTVIISFNLYCTHQYSNAVEGKAVNIPDEGLTEQDKIELEKQIVIDLFNDSTIQILDYDNSILQKDSIKFYYDIKLDVYLLIPDSFNLEVAEDHSQVDLISKDEEIKMWVYPRDEEIWKENNQLKRSLTKKGLDIETFKSNDSIFIISGNTKKGNVSHYSYLKILPITDEIDLFISYQTPSKHKNKFIIEKVLNQFPDKPF